MDQIALADGAGIPYRRQHSVQTQGIQRAAVQCHLGNEGQASGGQCPTEGAEHRPVMHRLRRRNRGIGVAHRRGDDEAALDDQRRLDPKKRRLPQHDVGQLTHLQRADQVADAVSDGGVDGVLGDVTLDPKIVGALTPLSRWRERGWG